MRTENKQKQLHKSSKSNNYRRRRTVHITDPHRYRRDAGVLPSTYAYERPSRYRRDSFEHVY